MTYEVRHGKVTRYTEAGNEYQACLDVLGDEAVEDCVQIGPFLVTRIPEGETQTVKMGVVVGIQQLAQNEEEERDWSKW